MKKPLSDKLVVVIGGAGILSEQITHALLNQNATVALLAASTQEINSHNYKSVTHASGRFIPYLTDPFDYIKCLDILYDLKVTYSGIDLVVTTLDNFCPQIELTHTKLAEWHNVTEQNIKFFFTNRLILSYLKDENSMYLTIGKHDHLHSNNQNNIADLTANQRLEIIETISSEFTTIKSRYHHLFFDTATLAKNTLDKNIRILADYIIELYISGLKQKRDAGMNSVFQDLKILPSIYKSLPEK